MNVSEHISYRAADSMTLTDPCPADQIVEWAFGKRMTPQQRLRKHQRALEKTQRELDRERVKLENQEKKLVQDIKKSAKNGQMGACKIQAKDLVRTRRSVCYTSPPPFTLTQPTLLRVGTLTNSTPCGLSSKPFRSGFRPFDRTSR